MALLAVYALPFIASIVPVELNRTMAARLVKSLAGPEDRPVTPSIKAMDGIASNETLKLPDWTVDSDVFPHTAEDVTHAPPDATLSVAELLVALPTEFVTTTEINAPLSAVVVGAVVYDEDVAPATAVPFFFH